MDRQAMEPEQAAIVAEHERCAREAEATARIHRDAATGERGRGPAAADLRRRLDELKDDALAFDVNAMGAGVLEDLDAAFSDVSNALANLATWTEPDR